MHNKIVILVLFLTFSSCGCFRMPSEPNSTDIEPGQLFGNIHLEYQTYHAGTEISLIGNKTLTTYSDSSGSFIFFNIPPGKYSISVKQKWFEPESLVDVTISSFVTYNYGQVYLYAGEFILNSGYDPCWSPFHYSEKFVFTRDISTSPHLFIYNLERNAETDLNRIGQSPQWSPTGTFIVYEIENGGIYKIDSDGTNSFQISHKGCKPVISSDGNKILFHREEVTDSGVYVINSDGTGLICIDSLGKNPAIAPDNNHIAYERNGEVIVTRLEYPEEKTIIGYGNKPTFSPQGEMIAYLYWGQYAIYVVDYSGNVVNTYYSLSYIINDISWYRLGSTILFSEEKNDIVLWNIGLNHFEMITNEGINPVCSPENQLLLFERNGGIRVFRLN